MVRPFRIWWTRCLNFLRYRPFRTGVVAIPPFTSDLRRHWSLAPGASGLPAALAAALATLTFLDGVGRNATTVATLLTAASAILVWNVWLIARARRRNQALTLQAVLRKQHYVQACAQGSVLLYWGWYWRPVYDAAPLIAAQLIFAYAFDMLLAWSRRSNLHARLRSLPGDLQHQPVPLVQAGLVLPPVPHGGRGLCRQGADSLEQGRAASSTSSILRRSRSRLFSLALILTGTSDVTRGQDIAISQFYPPHMYLLLFLVGLPGQFFFGVASMTLSAVAHDVPLRPRCTSP